MYSPSSDMGVRRFVRHKCFMLYTQAITNSSSCNASWRSEKRTIFLVEPYFNLLLKFCVLNIMMQIFGFSLLLP